MDKTEIKVNPKKSIISTSLKYIFILVLIYFPIFSFLDTLPIRIWDESRNAINALEMFHNGNYLIPHFEGSPDMWNTKPPFLIWLQVFFMNIVGTNELAIRLPSAIAASLTCLVLFKFSKKYIGGYWSGLVSILVLVTTNGYIHYHAARTGDYDALLTLLLTTASLSFFDYLEEKKTKSLYLIFLCLTLAVLTKSIAGLMFLPAMFIYALSQKKVLDLFRNKNFYTGALGFITCVVGYYVLREQYNPGYFEAVKQNELGGRYAEVIEGHNHGFWYYLKNLIKWHFKYWILFVPFGVAIGFYSSKKEVNRLTLFLCLLILQYFLVISTAQTKLEWYDVPLFPLLGLLITIFIFFVIEYLRNVKWENEILKANVFPLLFLIVVFVKPYSHIISKTFLPKEQGDDIRFYETTHYLKLAMEGKVDLDNYALIIDKYTPHNQFYTMNLSQQGKNVSMKYVNELKKGDFCFTDDEIIKKAIQSKYDYRIMRNNGNITFYKITNPLNH